MATLGIAIVRKEHESMPRVCPECGGEMEFTGQSLIVGDKPGDVLIYECSKCGHRVEKFFPFPPEYAKYFRK